MDPVNSLSTLTCEYIHPRDALSRPQLKVVTMKVVTRRDVHLRRDELADAHLDHMAAIQ
jgi:hypothetical protein